MIEIKSKRIVKTLFYDTNFNLREIAYTEGDNLVKITVEELKQRVLKSKDKEFDFVQFYVFLTPKGYFIKSSKFQSVRCSMIFDQPCPLEKQYGLNKLKLKTIYYSDKLVSTSEGYNIVSSIKDTYIVSRVIFDVLNEEAEKVEELEIWCPELYRNILVMDNKSDFATQSGLSALSFYDRKVILQNWSTVRKLKINIEEDPLMTTWKNKMSITGTIDKYDIENGKLKSYTGNDKYITLPLIMDASMFAFKKSPVEEVKLPKTFMISRDSVVMSIFQSKASAIVKFDYTNVDDSYNTSKFSVIQSVFFADREANHKKGLRFDNRGIKLCDVNE